YTLERRIHELFEDQASRYPSDIAIVDDRKSLCYSELNTRANQVVHYLISLGVTRNSLVGVYMTRSCDFLVTILAIMKAGVAYVPLDPTNPPERLSYMVQNSGAKVVLTQASHFGTLCLED